MTQQGYSPIENCIDIHTATYCRYNGLQTQRIEPACVFLRTSLILILRPFPIYLLNTAIIINSSHFHLPSLSFSCFFPILTFSPFQSFFSEVIIITYIQIHIEGFSVAVSVRGEHVLVEGPVYTYGWRRGELKLNNLFMFSSTTETNAVICQSK